MIALICLGLVLPQQESDLKTRVKALVRQLDSEDSVRRDEAQRQLVELGPEVVPHLKPYADAKSAEIAVRVRWIVEHFERIEQLAKSLPPVKLVTIPKGSHTAAEILEAVRAQSGYPVRAYGLSMRKPIDIGWEDAPVLKVLDDMCRALGRGRLQLPALRVQGDSDFWRMRHGMPEKEITGLAVEGDHALPAAVAHWNQFRAAVTDVVVTEEHDLNESSASAVVHITVHAQPGADPIYVGPWRLTEAVDDTGRLLVPGAALVPLFRDAEGPEVGDSPHSVSFPSGDFGWRGGGGSDQIKIGVPAPEARWIKRLTVKRRATFPYRRVSRTAKVEDVKDGGMISFGETDIAILKAYHEDGEFNLHYRYKGTARGSPGFEILDERGNPVRTGGGGSSGGGGLTKRSWRLRGGAQVASIRTSAYMGERTLEMTFEFHDIPLPEPEW